MFDKILVAFDACENCEPLFKRALALAQPTGASLTLLSVIPPMGDIYSPLGSYGTITHYPLAMDDGFWEGYQERFDASKRLGYTLLSGYAARAIAQGLPTEFVQATGSPGRQICDHAKSQKADLVMVGSHGRKGLGELIMGSVSNYVMHHAPCSVLVVHAKDTTTAEADGASAAFVRDNVELFLETRGNDADVQTDLALLRQEYQRETAVVPPWENAEEPVMAVPYIHDLLEYNRPSKALKSLATKMRAVGHQAKQLQLH
ncbi:MAG: universal stress protein [Cyanobacteria bacterium J06555_13]